jgi:uncharacterized membrane protein YphA (DoxX/SURF4 family)
MQLKDIIAAWDRIWFTETSPLPLGALRIAIGIIYFLFGVMLFPDRLIWFGPDAFTSQATTDLWCGIHALNVFYLYPESKTFVDLVFYTYIAASILFVVGYKARFAAFIMFVVISSLLHRNPFLFNSGDTFMRVTAFWLIFAPSDRALSLRNYILRKQGRQAEIGTGAGPAFSDYIPVCIWPLRLIQLQVAAVYCQTFFCKVVGPVWIEGLAVYYSSRIEDLQRFPMPFVFQNLLLIKVLSWGTLVLEFALWTAIWIKEFRYPLLAMAVAFHIVIDWHMNIPLFEYLMISSYLAFIYPEDLASACRWLSKKQ